MAGRPPQCGRVGLRNSPSLRILCAPPEGTGRLTTPGKVKRKRNGEQSRDVKWFGQKLVSEHCSGIMELWMMVWLVCCSQVAPVGSQVWGGSKPPGSVSPACLYVGDWTASPVGVPPFRVRRRMSHVSAPPWRAGPACTSPSWTALRARALPSWVTGHLRVPVLDLGKVLGSGFSSGHVLCVAVAWALHQSGSLCNWF